MTYGDAFNSTDREFMARALRLAARGLYGTDPNPRVGCVLVLDGQVVGEGFHAQVGGPHAEIGALRAAGDRARGADCYVTLEPCNHRGRTGPCTEALIRAGVCRVVAAMQDPNPEVAGNGLARLREAGIEAQAGLMAAQAADLNPGFIARCTRGRPWVRVKLAASLDGRTAVASGESRWITGEAARADVQTLRARSSVILTGIGTVLADDPRLDVRLETPRQPRRVILDPACETPPQARLFRSGGPVTVFCAEGATPPGALRERAAIVPVGAQGDALDLAAVMARLGADGVNEVHVEAGARLAGALLCAGLVDELVIYLAPTLLGHEGRPLVEIPGIGAMSERLSLQWRDVRWVGDDLRLILRPDG